MTSYALVSPVRNEQATLGAVGLTLYKQTVPPDEWVIVDDHSLVRLLPFARAIRSPLPADDDVNSGAVRARDVYAFEAGVENFTGSYDFVGKLDGDVALISDYYERLLERFDADPTLGVAGGVCYENGSPVAVTTQGSVRGAARLYRWDCWERVTPLDKHLGWDGIDLVRAHLAGYTTESFAIPFDHLRPAGTRR